MGVVVEDSQSLRRLAVFSIKRSLDKAHLQLLYISIIKVKRRKRKELLPILISILSNGLLTE